jgi:hypothetical protein
VHSALVRFHVRGSPGKQLFEFALCLGGEWPGSMRLLRRNRVEVETNATGRREVREGTFDFCTWRVGRRVVEAPEAMPGVSGKRGDPHGLNEIISGHAGNAIGRARDDATHCSLAHGRDAIRRRPYFASSRVGSDKRRAVSPAQAAPGAWSIAENAPMAG